MKVFVVRPESSAEIKPMNDAVGLLSSVCAVEIRFGKIGENG